MLKLKKEDYEKKKTDIVEQYSQEELKIYLDLAKKEAALLSGDDKNLVKYYSCKCKLM